MSIGLVAQGLRKSYGPRLVVSDASFTVSPGEIVGLLGPNGAGKTTCFRMVVGMVLPDRGAVTLDGADLGRQPLWRRVRAGLGYLPQKPAAFRKLSVKDNLRIPLQARGAASSALEALLVRSGLTDVANTPAGLLSGGQRRRLDIARCLAGQPRILLLDEPFAGVDPVAVAGLQEQIRALVSEGIGVLVTDHAVRETLMLCDRAVILDGGEVIARGTPAEVTAVQRVQERYLGAGFNLSDS